MRASVVIPTYNRPQELENCLRSLARQTVLPWEIVVIDDGDLPGMPLHDKLTALGIRCVFERKDTPGLVASRNLGAVVANGEVVFYLDDDVVLFPDYIERILACFDLPEQPLGVGGLIENIRPMTPGRLAQYLLQVLCNASGLREGRVLASGFTTDYGTTPFPLHDTTRVDYLSGGVCAFKREVFHGPGLRFSDAFRSLSGYSQGEDKEFSYRVSQHGALLVEPRAKLYHYEAPKTGYDKRAKGRAVALSRFYFLRDTVRPRPWRWAAFWLALSGYTLIRVLAVLAGGGRSEWHRVQGLAGAIRDILLHRTGGHL